MKYLTTTLYGLMIALIIAVGVLIMSTTLPMPGGLELKIVKSGSMEPSIMTGSLIFIWPTAAYQVGDVITFGPDTKTQIPTTHRIVEVRGEGRGTTFITQGDANDVVDSGATRVSEVIGKVVFSIPKAGFVLDFARTQLGFMLMVVVPAICILLDEMMVLYGEVRRWKKKAHSRTSSNPTPRAARLRATATAQSGTVENTVPLVAQAESSAAVVVVPKRPKPRAYRPVPLSHTAFDGIITYRHART